jgi:hypothetical protein
MSEPFMEHPDGTFDRATDAIADAVKRLRELPAWDEWITFCAQGYGGQPDTYRLAEIKLRRDKIASELPLPSGAEQFDIAGSSPAAVAAFLDELFRKHMGIQPFPNEGDDYAVGAEW